MRSTDEQLREIMRRKDEVIEKQSIRRHLHACALAACACILLLVMTAVSLPKITTDSLDHATRQYGSLLLAAPYMGYVVVGVLTFALGICVTLFCIRWKELEQKEREKE